MQLNQFEAKDAEIEGVFVPCLPRAISYHQKTVGIKKEGLV
jgi:hypothetical protein